MTLAIALLSCLAAGQLAANSPSAIVADTLEQDQSRGLAIARGHVRLRSGALVLHTGELRYEQSTGRFEADGPVFGVEGHTLLTAASARGSLATAGASEAATPISQLTLSAVRIEEYRWLPPDLGQSAETAAAARLGKTLLMAVEGRTLRQLGPGHYQLDGVLVSPCSCSEGVPAGGCPKTWALASGQVDVHAGDYAWLQFPALELGGLPLPLLRPPVLYVPLGDRRSGFLLPHFNWQSQNGFLLDEPYFLTLGPSADLTVSAGLVTGEPESGAGANGVAGPRLGLEFRYAPAAGTTGRLFLQILDDQHHDLALDGSSEMRGGRGLLRALQIQDLGPNDGDRWDLNLASDARLTGQLTTDLLFAQIPGLRSAAFAFHRERDWLLTVDAVYLQDFEGLFGPNNFHELLFGPGAPHTLARLPGLSARLAEVAVGRTPLRFSFDGSLSRQGALDARYDSLAFSTLAPPTALNSMPAAVASAVPAARASLEQLDLKPTLSWPLQLGHLATASASAAWRQDVWLFDGPPVPGLPSPALPSGERGYPIFDLEARTELWRDFGSGAAQLRHLLEPELELRAIPFQQQNGSVPLWWFTPSGAAILDHSTGLPTALALPLIYDPIGPAAGSTAPAAAAVCTTQGCFAPSTAPGGLAQGQLHVDQRLRAKTGELARLDLGENFDGAGFESSYGLAGFHLGPVQLQGFANFSNQPLPCPGCRPSAQALRRLSEAWADGAVTDDRGDALSLGLVRAIAAGAPHLSAPLDLMFAPLPAAGDLRWALPDISQLMANATAQFGAGLVGHAGAAYEFSAGALAQLTAGLGFHSPQRCCALDLNAIFQPSAPGSVLGFAAFSLVLDLGEFAGSAAH